ncbi:MAG: glycosyltransferase family 39 protein [Chloroflexota bacterium]
MATLTVSSKPPFLSRKLALGITPAHILLIGVMLLSVGLHFANLDAIGDANTYYTAAVESMLQSWSNFFFAAAEPGGSVTVDKPPLGLWIEAAFAFFLGVEGWVVSLPNILAGIFSAPLLYYLVKKYMGELAGLVAALVLAVTPVAVATDRNNTMDGMLVFTLLLAAWAFVAATETGKSRWLFLGAFIVGLGFNIKMLQAFLPLPAFYALYFLGAKTGWWKKILSIGVSAVILLVVSLAWVVIVDLTPADRRPYIGSSEDNTVMELIVGHNGLSRLFNPRSGGNAPAQAGTAPDAQQAAPGGQAVQPPGVNPGGQALQSPPPRALEACQGLSLGEACSFTQPNGKDINGVCIIPPASDQLACAPQGRLPQNGQPAPGGQYNQPRPGFDPPAGMLGDGPNASPDGPKDAAGNTPFSQETGSPGIARFFVYPLSKQMSWLLPFALIGLGMAVFAARPRLPLEAEHKALVLWGGWLLTCLVFFSAVEGIFHAYYAIMLAPALGAVVGMGIALFWRWQAARPWVNAGLVIAAAVTVAFQVFTAAQYGFESVVVYAPVALLGISAPLLFVKFLRPAGYIALLAALVMIPFLWTGMTVLDRAPNTSLPTSIDAGAARQTQPRPAPALNEPNQADSALVDYLQANTQDVEYLAAVQNAHTGAPLVLATGRPVLYMGGFGGNDPVIDAAGLAEMVANGQLRYVLFGGDRGRQDIAEWLQTSCTVAPGFSQGDARPAQGGQRPGNGQPNTLYQCGP